MTDFARTVATVYPVKFGQCKSFSEISVTGKGQEIPNTGSSWRVPQADFGSYGDEMRSIDFDIIAERLEAVGKSSRNVEYVTVPARQFEFLPVAVSWRFRPDIDDDVPNGSADATDSLGFTMRFALVVHASQTSPARSV